MTPDQVLRSIEGEAPRRNLPIIGPVRGLLLDETVTRFKPLRVLEVGTLVGYSAVRIGRLLGEGGRLTCVEVNGEIAKEARMNIERAGLSGKVSVVVGDAKEVIPTLSGPFDMVFLDAAKDEYLDYLRSCEGLIRKGSVVLADNVKRHQDILTKYLEYVRASGKYRSEYKESSPNPWQTERDAVEVSVRL